MEELLRAGIVVVKKRGPVDKQHTQNFRIRLVGLGRATGGGSVQQRHSRRVYACTDCESSPTCMFRTLLASNVPRNSEGGSITNWRMLQDQRFDVLYFLFQQRRVGRKT